MLFWTPHFSVLDSTFWLDSTLKIDSDANVKARNRIPSSLLPVDVLASAVIPL